MRGLEIGTQVAAFASATLCQVARITKGREENDMAESAVVYRADGSMEQRLISAVRRAVTPKRVDGVRITHADAGLVLGFIRTSCPLENQSHLEDFEAHLHGKNGRFLDYVVIGGRKIRPTGSARGRTGRRRTSFAESKNRGGSLLLPREQHLVEQF